MLKHLQYNFFSNDHASSREAASVRWYNITIGCTHIYSFFFDYSVKVNACYLLQTIGGLVCLTDPDL